MRPNLKICKTIFRIDSRSSSSALNERFWSSGRLKTYVEWPFKPEDGICTPERMAAAGFYVVAGNDEPDVVECFVCAKQLDGWDANDDPWQEHAKHQRDCPFVLLNKQDEKKWTIEDFFNLMKVYYAKECARKTDEFSKNLKVKSEIMAKKIPQICRAERNSRKGGK